VHVPAHHDQRLSSNVIRAADNSCRRS
jgi:hypothetical protein